MSAMDEGNKGQEAISDGVVFGHRVCQTKDAQWLCLDNMYQKFYRNNLYDIGGTYIEDVSDFWFLYRTETVGDIFLLHLLVSNRHETSFNISVSFGNEMNIDKKNGIVYLPKDLKELQFSKQKEMSQNYITTYSFTDLDVDALMDRKLYIAISFSDIEDKGIKQEVIDHVKVNHDFSILMTDPICTDFVIESADGDKFRVHKVLLLAHSEVFKAMLKEDTAESQNNYVKLVDVCTDDLRGILEFVYTGTIKDIDAANFFNLLMLADQYNLKGLRELAQYTLSQQLCTDNALEVLVVADMYNSDILKQTTLKFIKKNVASLKSSTFKEIKNADLIRELCEYIVPKD
uniref:BTB domain-containing protein n=1 Tax=Pectinophora gossypiella TaxID=13191 RepID=A0A1E1WJI1_PECGO